MNTSHNMNHLENIYINIENMSDSNSTSSSLTPSSTGTNVSRDRERLQLMDVYGKGKTKQFNKSTMQSINRAIRKVLIPRMKFVNKGKELGSFDQPDFTDPNSWIHRVFSQLGALQNLSATNKAEIWMTYKMKIREQFSLHRSSVTIGLKKAFIAGKNVYNG